MKLLQLLEEDCTLTPEQLASMANMTVICPADGIETSKAVQACVDTPGPVYIRIGRGFEPPCYESDNYTYEIGKAITMREGTDLTIICCGIAVLQAMNAARSIGYPVIIRPAFTLGGSGGGVAHSEAELDTMRALKKLFDPKNILNPHKVYFPGAVKDIPPPLTGVKLPWD